MQTFLYFCLSEVPPAPLPLFLFLICTLYEELWQCCVFTDVHLVTHSFTSHVLTKFAVFVMCNNTICLLKQRTVMGSLKKQFFNNRFCISSLKLSQLNLVNKWRKRVCFWLQFFCILHTLAADPARNSKSWYFCICLYQTMSHCLCW